MNVPTTADHDCARDGGDAAGTQSITSGLTGNASATVTSRFSQLCPSTSYAQIAVSLRWNDPGIDLYGADGSAGVKVRTWDVERSVGNCTARFATASGFA